MINLNLNVNQINNTLDELNKINNVNGCYSLLASSSSAEVRQKEGQSTVRKIVNYFADWWQGKNEKAATLSQLTGRISQIVKDQKVNPAALSIEKVDNAIKGLKKYQTQFDESKVEGRLEG